MLIAEIITERLKLNLLTIDDHPFILQLLNSLGWLKFIGNRNVDDSAAAIQYIINILDNPDIIYLVVKLKNGPIGIITFLKRDYLEHYDLGFAFLPDFTGQGYALEAARAALKHFSQKQGINQFQAITIAENNSSVNLLTKLGFIFDGEMQKPDDNNILRVYSLTLPA